MCNNSSWLTLYDIIIIYWNIDIIFDIITFLKISNILTTTGCKYTNVVRVLSSMDCVYNYKLQKIMLYSVF